MLLGTVLFLCTHVISPMIIPFPFMSLLVSRSLFWDIIPSSIYRCIFIISHLNIIFFTYFQHCHYFHIIFFIFISSSFSHHCHPLFSFTAPSSSYPPHPLLPSPRHHHLHIILFPLFPSRTITLFTLTSSSFPSGTIIISPSHHHLRIITRTHHIYDDDIGKTFTPLPNVNIPKNQQTKYIWKPLGGIPCIQIHSTSVKTV